MKATFESIEPSFGSSFSFTRFEKDTNFKSHFWHYHPEIELVLVNGGSGKRQIGSHISYYTKGDLILIGSNLPHCGFTDESTGNSEEYVLHMKPEFLGSSMLETPEFEFLSQLFNDAKIGIAYGIDTRMKVEPILSQMQNAFGLERLLGLLTILKLLNEAEDVNLLNADGFSIETQIQDNDRINTVFNFVKDHFQQPISLEEMADRVSMTVPGFCRYFKKVTNKTFTRFVNEYRVVHASKLLAEKTLSIADIAEESGFNNFSYFNKVFKELTGASASEYRKQYKVLVK